MDAPTYVSQGKAILDTLSPESEIIEDWKSMLGDYAFEPGRTDDPPSWLTCVLALKAASMGNFGVGSLLLAPDGTIAAMGHNEVFSPTFRSCAHAEMVVMDEFEKQHRKRRDLSGYTLYSSLESCPMCMTRLIIAGVGRVLHLAWDEHGGMVHIKDNLPDIVREFAEKQDFSLADCSDELKKAAWDIFDISREDLDKRILES